MVTQMSLPCYFGNEIILKHEDLRGKAFESGWHLQSTQYRTIVMIFMELVKEKRRILVGNWFALDLNLFTSVSEAIFFPTCVWLTFQISDNEFCLSTLCHSGLSEYICWNPSSTIELLLVNVS